MKELEDQLRTIKECKKRIEKARQEYKKGILDCHKNMDNLLEKYGIEGRSNAEQRKGIIEEETAELRQIYKELEASLAFKEEMYYLSKINLRKEERQIDLNLNLNLNVKQAGDDIK